LFALESVTLNSSQLSWQFNQCVPRRTFSPQRAEDKQKVFSHIPFGGGIRECLGKEFARLEMKLFAALLVRDYEWELVPGQNLERVVLPFSRPRDRLKVTFKRYRSPQVI
jgi:retinoid hydroxylase